jgi:predicted nucleic acid-binding protein
MANKDSKRLVIDTSVARSAGGENAVHPEAKDCRDFLKTVLSIGHSIVVNAEMKAELKKHESNFFRKWQVQMVAKRKFIYVDEDDKNFSAIKTQIESLAKTYENREAMEKDCFLLELALLHDKIVVSKDETVRELFRQISAQVKEIREVNWINPINPEETPIDWLKEGANLDYKRSIGYRTKNDI